MKSLPPRASTFQRTRHGSCDVLEFVHGSPLRVALVPHACHNAVSIPSAGHPTADRRTFGDLRASDVLGGVRIVSVQMVTYPHQCTFDILPASETGFYFAGGALIGSTLAAAVDAHPG
jgi:hypothetical protein